MIRPRPFCRAVAARLTLCMAGLGVLFPTPANAYVRYRADNGSPYFWKPSCVQITGYPQGLPSMTIGQIKNAMTDAVGAWSNSDPALGGCSYLALQLTLQDPAATAPDAKYDSYNNVVLRTDAWTTLCSIGPNGAQVCHDPSALAITSVFANKNTGQIVDADIEVNAVVTNFMWADLTASAPTHQMQDLQNALTHEVGHLIGLDHTCYIFSSGGADDPAHLRPVDQNGNPIPNCNDASDAVEATTMFASANPGDISKRTLEPDDQEAVCAVYPLASDPRSCAPAYDQQAACDAVPRASTTQSCPSSPGQGSGGCTLAPATLANRPSQSRHSGWMIGAVSLASMLFALTRRPRRPRHPLRGE